MSLNHHTKLGFRLLRKLTRVNVWSIVWLSVFGAVVLTEFVVSVMSLLFHGRINLDYLITGAVAALVVASLIVTVIVVLLSRIKQFDSSIKNLGAELEERVRIEKALKKSEQQYRLLFHSNPHPMWVYDLETLAFLDVNEAAIKHYGYTRDEFLSRTIKDIRPEEDLPRLMENVSRVTDGLDEAGVWRHRKKDGTIIDVDIISHTLEYGGRRAELVLVNDVTASRRAEEALRVSEERYRLLSESALTGVYLIQDRIFQYVNPVLASIFGYTVDDLVGKKGPLDLTTGEDRMKVADNIRRRVDGEITSVRYTFKGVRKDETIIDVEVHGGLTTFNGKPAIVGTLVEISERKRAEDELKRRNDYLETIMDSSMDLVFTLTNDAKFTFANSQLTPILGYTLDDIRQKDFSEFAHPEDLPRVMSHWKLLLRGEHGVFEAKVLRKDGSFAPCRLAYSPIPGFGENLVFLNDMTEQKRSEESEKKLLRAVEQTGDVIFMTDPDGKISYVNPAFEKLYGFTSEEVIGQTPQILKSGLLSSEFYQRFWQKLKSGQSFYGEIVNKARDGRIVHIEATVNPIINGGGKTAGFVAVQKNITERKKGEEDMKKLELHLAQMQKMESLGTLAGGIAHDFNNILGIILAYSSTLDKFKNDHDRVQEAVNIINKSVQRGASLVRQILTFARKADVKLEPIRINDVITELSSMLEETFPKTIERVLLLEQSLPVILSDHTQLHQALLNLCVNARDAMSGKGVLTVQSRYVTGGAIVDEFPLALGRHFVEIDVSDTGMGMDEQTKSRIFEPFFTTKQKGKGTGLGLAVVFGIVQAHQGLIDVKSLLGAGTTFRLFLPIPDEVLGGNHFEVHDDERESTGGTETVLIVEDEAPLRMTLKDALEGKGYRVLTAIDGEEGIQIFAENLSDIDLVITDLGLPRLSGDQLFLTIHKMNRFVPVIVASGFVDPEVKSELFKAGVKECMVKPYSRAEMLAKVREVLDLQQREKQKKMNGVIA